MEYPDGATLTDAFFIIFDDKVDVDLGYRLYIVYSESSMACPTKYFLGHDFDAAQAYVNDLNIRLGLTPAIAHELYEFVSGLDRFRFYEA
jgi:hypothetical protein